MDIKIHKLQLLIATLVASALASACSQDNEHQVVADTQRQTLEIERNTVRLSLMEKKMIEMFGKPQCELNVHVANGLESQIKFSLSNYEFMNSDPLIVGGLSARFIDTMTVDSFLFTSKLHCDDINVVTVRETLCETIDENEQALEDCRQNVALVSNDALQFIDKRYY